MLKLFGIILLILLVIEGNSQEKWDYKRCVEYAVSNNLDLLNSKLNIDKQELVVNSQFYNMLPGASGSINYYENSGIATDPNTNDIIETTFFSNKYSVGTSVNLFNGFRQLNRIFYEKYNLKITKSQYARNKNDLIFNVLNAFVICNYTRGLSEVAKKQYELSKKELEKITRLADIGRAAKADVFETEARTLNSNYNLLNMENRYNKSLHDLKTLMNFPFDTELNIDTISKTIIFSAPENKDSIIILSKQLSLDIKILENHLLATKKNLQMIKAGALPSLSFSAGWGTGFYETNSDSVGNVIPFADQFNDNDGFNYGFRLSIPLFDRFYRRNNIKTTKINLIQAENELKTKIKELEYEVNEALLDLKASKSEYLLAQKRLEAQKIAYQTSEKKKEKGLISIMDFYESQNNLFQAEVEVLRTRQQLFLKEKTINFYLTGSFIN